MEFNLADLFECVASHVGEREAVVSGSTRRTYEELDVRSSRLADGLARLGVRPGDHVGLHQRNTVEHVESLLACFKARAVPVNVNWRYVGPELTYLFRDAGISTLVVDDEFAGRAADVAGDVPALGTLVVVGGDPPGDAVRFEDVVASGSAGAMPIPRSADDRYVLYTGGTTGMPKGVVWRQEDIFFAVLGGGNPGGPPITRPEEIGPSVLANRAHRLGPLLPPGDPGPDQFVQLALGPLMHAGGQWSALGTLLGGGKVVLYPHAHVDMENVLDLVEAERVTALNLVGDTSARPLLDAMAPDPTRWDTSSLRLLGSGATLLSAATKARLLEAFPSVVAITEAIGSSEAPVQGVSITTRDGTPPPSLRFTTRDDTTVLDDDLRPVEPGSGRIGRLATRGRVPLGYHGDPGASEATFVEIDGVRWTLPGDMATVEPDGAVRVLGRGALCINTGGEKVFPEEVEAVLVTHPDVAEALVVGAPDDRHGEKVVALVAPAGDTPPALDALQAHCRGHLAGYKLPRAVVAVDSIERSPAGKPDYEWARRVAAAGS